MPTHTLRLILSAAALIATLGACAGNAPASSPASSSAPTGDGAKAFMAAVCHNVDAGWNDATFALSISKMTSDPAEQRRLADLVATARRGC